MNEHFVERVERAIACGLEKRPQKMGQTRQRREHTVQVNGDGAPCAHCGEMLAPIRSDMKYCSVRCRQLAYHQRLALAESVP